MTTLCDRIRVGIAQSRVACGMEPAGIVDEELVDEELVDQENAEESPRAHPAPAIAPR